MRVLFASLASAGHAYPLLPLATATRDAGHDVHFAAGEHVHPALSGLNPFRPADAFHDIYPEDLAPDLERLAPDLVVAGWGVPGAARAARAHGVPALWHGFGRMVPDGIGLESPLTAVPGLAHLDICPESLQDKTFLSEPRIPLRPVPHADPGRAPDLPAPLVYLTLGTAFATATLLRTALDALAPLAPVVAATGNVPPAAVNPVPANASVHAWLPQTEVIAHAALVVHHGGSGTMLAALAAGVPQLLLPQGADQFANATALTAAGACLSLDPADQTADAIATHAHTLLTDPAYRDSARSLATTIAAMPSPAAVARRLPDHAAGAP